MRRWVTIVVAILAVAASVSVALSIAAPPPTDHVEEGKANGSDLVELENSESAFWPYLSTRHSFRRGSAVNVVVRSDLDTTLARMQRDTDVEWNRTEPTELDADEETFSAEEIDPSDGTSVDWGDATGSERYAFITPTGDPEDGTWFSESAQVHHGDYYGHRYHIRLYEAPDEDDEWVIMQAHTEHFDWFTLRHSVHGNEQAQRHVELDFIDQPFVEEVWRKHADNDEPYDSDGWITIVEFALLLPLTLVGTVGRSGAIKRRGRAIWRNLESVDRQRLQAAADRFTLAHVLLFGAIVGLVLGVRAGGIVLENNVPALSMHGISALLYPFLALGVPIATYAIARRIDRRMDAAVVASAALSTAIILDYSAIGVATLPIEIVLHRTAVIVSLGLLAAGATERGHKDARNALPNGWLVAGAALWVGLLVAILGGWI